MNLAWAARSPTVELIAGHFHPAIHPDDLRAAVNAKVTQRLRERVNVTPEEVLEDLWIVWLVRHQWDACPFMCWPESLQREVMSYAVENNRPQFLLKLGKALLKEYPDEDAGIWAKVDLFILENQRWGLCLRKKEPREAVKLIGQANSILKYTLTEQEYMLRRKRLGQVGPRTARKRVGK
jgi:hypothetical protein